MALQENRDELIEKVLTLEGKENWEILLIHVLECDNGICYPAFRTPHSTADSVTD